MWVCGGILHPCPGCSQQTFSDCGAGRALSAGSVLGCSGFLQGCSKSRREESGSEDLTEELWLLPTLQAWLMVLWGHGLLPAKKHKQRRYFRKTYSKRKNYHYSNALLQRWECFSNCAFAQSIHCFSWSQFNGIPCHKTTVTNTILVQTNYHEDWNSNPFWTLHFY